MLTAFGILIMMADPLLKPGASRKGLGLLSLAGAIAAIAATFCQIAWLARDNSFPDGAILLTGTGIVPPNDFTLEAGDVIAIAISGIGRLRNIVAQGPAS